MLPRLLSVAKALRSNHQLPAVIYKVLLSTSTKAKDITFSSSLGVVKDKLTKKSQNKNLSEKSPKKKETVVNSNRDFVKKLNTEYLVGMPLRSKFKDSDFESRKSKVLREGDSKRKALNPNNVVEVIKELPGDDKEDVLFNTIFGARIIELNRPSKFNALNGSMIRKIVPRLQEWAKSDMANVVIIKGCGPKAFCAGGDVKELVELNRSGKDGQRKSADYFALEYKLNHLIATYSKPYIAFMDGFTMGGGVGLSIHAPIRIATERTVFAMPETKIGLFPDIGASFFLPRLNGSVGTYLALTGDNIKGVDVLYSGIATHYVHSSSLYSLEMRLAELRFRDYDSLEERLNLINSTIEEFVTGLPHDKPMSISGKVRKAIDRCFDKGSMVSIFAALEAETEVNKGWSETTLKTLQCRSPTSLCVTLRLMQLGKKWTIAEAFRREHLLSARFMAKSDFNEGVDALLIRKDGSPKWDPPSIKDIETENAIVEPYFKIDAAELIELLNDVDFEKYPLNNYGLPSEEAIMDVIKKSGKEPSQAVDYFVGIFKGKQGVREVVEEFIQRKYRES